VSYNIAYFYINSIGAAGLSEVDLFQVHAHVCEPLVKEKGDKGMKAARPNLFVVLSRAVVLLLGPGIVQATIYNQVRLTHNEYNDEYPSIGGNKIVWQGWDGFDYEIYCYDMVSGETTQITHNLLYNDMYPRTNGEYIVWTQREPGEYFFALTGRYPYWVSPLSCWQVS
jgi:beta propeller repeat protein